MNLILLHGAPAVGKLTIARELSRIITGKVFDNHASIDLALHVFDFGDSDFQRLVVDCRLLAIKYAACSKNVENLVTTMVYAHPNDISEVIKIKEIVNENNGNVLPVYLHCSIFTSESRINNKERIARNKISNVDLLRSIVRNYEIKPVPFDNCIEIDTDKFSPFESAMKIKDIFNLR